MKHILQELLCKDIWITTNEIMEFFWRRFPETTRQGILMALHRLEEKGLIEHRKVDILHSRNGLSRLTWKKI